MIDVETAKKLILQNQPQAKVQIQNIRNAAGFYLAEDVFSQTDLPVFDASAMDGYVLRCEDAEFSVIEEIWAGKVPQKIINAGQCARIMTGAMIPPGADTVVMQENVQREGNILKVNGPLKVGQHIRRKGEEIKAGEEIMKQGEKITPAALGCLASAGIAVVHVFAKPKVCIIPTGSELAVQGSALSPGQIYESNSFALRAAISELGIDANVFPIQRDDQAHITSALSKALSEATHVIVCGGVSVGEYDFVKKAFADCHVKEVFWKVAQKPGKPLFFGVRDDVNVFGLPGNPASSLVCYYEYIRAALLAYERGLQTKNSDVSELQLKNDTAVLCEPVTKKKGLTYFMRGKAVADGEKISVMVLPQQDSHMMKSFLQSNCLVVLSESAEFFDAGTRVKIHYLPSV